MIIADYKLSIGKDKADWIDAAIRAEAISVGNRFPQASGLNITEIAENVISNHIWNLSPYKLLTVPAADPFMVDRFIQNELKPRTGKAAGYYTNMPVLPFLDIAVSITKFRSMFTYQEGEKGREYDTKYRLPTIYEWIFICRWLSDINDNLVQWDAMIEDGTYWSSTHLSTIGQEHRVLAMSIKDGQFTIINTVPESSLKVRYVIDVD
ncbi:MAG: hypothetical protein KBS89_07525 [Bacteroidales bacterium]|nr:hypothetical protein [Candidatus Egerieousia equi]